MEARAPLNPAAADAGADGNSSPTQGGSTGMMRGALTVVTGGSDTVTSGVSMTVVTSDDEVVVVPASPAPSDTADPDLDRPFALAPSAPTAQPVNDNNKKSCGCSCACSCVSNCFSAIYRFFCPETKPTANHNRVGSGLDGFSLGDSARLNEEGLDGRMSVDGSATNSPRSDRGMQSPVARRSPSVRPTSTR